MMPENKVKVEITADGWRIELTLDGRTYVGTGRMHNSGSATHGGNSFEDIDMPEELYEALETFFCFDVASALWTIEEEEGRR